MRLCDRLSEARRIAAERAQLEKSAAQRAARRRAEEARRQALAPDARRGVRKARRRRRGRRSRWRSSAPRRGASAGGRTRAGLQQLGEAGDGLSEAELRAEQQALDPALLGDEIAHWKARRAELAAGDVEAARAVRDAEAEYEALARGRDAAGAARERMEARGELLDIAERWLLRQGAARLAARAIERHRAAAQDPLIAPRRRAVLHRDRRDPSSGSATDYDDADRPVLVARAADGERVSIEGLSEGARDQLFLALRLALLERRAGEPLPFIGDDILASFDDERTGCTLALLADFGRAPAGDPVHPSPPCRRTRGEAGADVVSL